MIEAGLTVAFSSDGPVIGDINPLLGLQSAALRRARSGRVIAPEQAIAITQALWCSTNDRFFSVVRKVARSPQPLA
jgi:predicted amidohydrolase YtcJ